jgi:FkbM family methyltransferase
MKKIIYTLISKCGYRIENKNKIKVENLKFVNQFEARINQHLVVKSIEFIKEILYSFPDLQIKDCDYGLNFNFQEIKIYVETYEEILIISEIFVKKEYDFFTSEKIVLCDIGANIGLASIFLSLKENIEAIYAFEPVCQTYHQALINFKLNSHFLKVKSIKNYGLAKNDRDQVFLFNSNVKGNTGIRGSKSSSFVAEAVTNVNVKLKNASNEIEMIIKEHPNSKIAIKVDCEGGEYEIFEDLNESGCLKKIDYIILEWHDEGSSSLELILRDNKFEYFARNMALSTGMIYAINRGKN